MCPKIELWERHGDQARTVHEGDWPVLPAPGDRLHVVLIHGHAEFWEAVGIRHHIRPDGSYEVARIEVRPLQAR